MLKSLSKYHTDLIFWGLILVAVGLPLSVFTVSVGQIFLLLGWLIQGKYKQRLITFFSDPLSLILISIYIIFVLGMLHTQNYDQGWKELRIKLPLFLMPLVLFTTQLPNKKRIQSVLFMFVVATVAGTLVGYLNRNYFEDPNLLNKRSLSLFISHIRFGLMIVFSFFLLAYYLVAKRRLWSITEKVLSVITMIWLFYFLILLESPSGYLAFVTILGFSLVRLLFASKYSKIRWATLLVIVSGGLASFIYVHAIYQNHSLEYPFDYRTQKVHTQNGRMYVHEKDVKYTENGHRVWNYVCWEELNNEWPKRSDMDLKGLDRSGQQVRFTLIRYLTSRGLTKDSVGVHTLTDQDVHHIESGFTNYKYVDRWGVSRRIDQLLWEIDEYRWNGNPNTSSLILRLTYFKAGINIVNKAPLLGVGTGDVYDAYDRLYEENDMGLNDFRKTISHNQFLTVAIAVGLVGLIWFVFAFFFPLVYYWKDYLFTAFILLIAVSLLSDNTFDNQSGVTLYSFFAALLMIRKEFED